MDINIREYLFFFFQAEDGIRDLTVTGVQTCALPISSLKLNMLTSPFHTKALAREIPIFEKATGIGLGDLIEVGILQIQAKAMAEAVARSGSFDFWVGDPISLPDTAEAGLARPIDEFAARGLPDVDDVVGGFAEQGRYKGKTYGLFAGGDHFLPVLPKDWPQEARQRQKVPPQVRL